MKIIKIILLISFIFLFYSCAKENNKSILIKEKSLDLQVLEAYSLGMDALESGDVLYAAQKFNDAEILYPQSEWAPKSALMAAYSYYVQDYYGDAIQELLRFREVYPRDINIDYANYLLGICYFEQIVDEKKDSQSILNAKNSFLYVVNNFSNTDYAIDAKFKIDLIDDILAAKEMYIGRYYFDKRKWIASIGRFRTVLDSFDTTIYVEEALHRLVEIHYILGLEEEAKKYATLLGYNYKSSEWYKRTYSVFDRNYREKKLKDKKYNKSMIKKVKSLFN